MAVMLVFGFGICEGGAEGRKMGGDEDGSSFLLLKVSGGES